MPVDVPPAVPRAARRPDLVAHRGWALRFPENTLVALRAALDVGARFVELDVQLSADGVAHVFHDATLRRLCGVDGRIHDKSAAELAELSAHYPKHFGDKFLGEPVATLADFARMFAGYDGRHAFVELKHESHERFGVPAMLDAVLEALEPIADRCSLISFDHDALTAARARCALPVGPVLREWEDRLTDTVRALEPEWVFADIEDLPTEGPLRVEHGALAIYEVANPALALELAGRGVQLVETFAIGELLADLARA